MKKRIVYDFVTDSGRVFRREYITKDTTDYERVKTILNKKDDHNSNKYIVVLEANV